MSDHDSSTLGIDMGGTNVRWSVVRADGTVLETASRTLPSDTGARAQLPLEIAGELADRVSAIGLAVAGTVAGGVLTWSANLGLSGIPYAQLLSERTGRPAVVLNDARAAGLAEATTGAGRGFEHVLVLTVGTGIGGAVVIGGRLLLGTGDAGEVGHMVVDANGRPCGCGRRGCWEVMVGGRALRASARAMFPATSDPLGLMIERADAGDPRACDVLDAASGWFALGVDNLCAILGPDVIVLGGGIMARDGTVAARYRRAARATRWGRSCELRDSALGDAAGQLGAALAARDGLTANQ